MCELNQSVNPKVRNSKILGVIFASSSLIMLTVIPFSTKSKELYGNEPNWERMEHIAEKLEFKNKTHLWYCSDPEGIRHFTFVLPLPTTVSKDQKVDIFVGGIHIKNTKYRDTGKGIMNWSWEGGKKQITLFLQPDPGNRYFGEIANATYFNDEIESIKGDTMRYRCDIYNVSIE